MPGDTNEISSIYQVFCEGKQRQNDLIVGSVKANIGHLEAVAGLAGLLKSINVLNSKLIPPQLHFVEPKPALKLGERHIKVGNRCRSLHSMPLTENCRLSQNCPRCHLGLPELRSTASGMEVSSSNGSQTF